ncbi:hypothetical protein DQM68_19540 (plasmid) [Leptospira mayottensis]|uniref:Uncharacterized protein n=1 Tax=Leptospira mayottensis 200901116 TaxID=1192864 RepID=M6VBU9_9LEPT|nr:hypothetical protein [Leptospira mayottensis]AVH81625.1 hypothetical protein [Leptospira mayottensis 200901116]AXR62862.1 hypothetical protein DQM68_19540 [Leptospira mayottensis]TGN00386.1 hypothetical protein EHR03_13250 [Leptospira mayottensis]
MMRTLGTNLKITGTHKSGKTIITVRDHEKNILGQLEVHGLYGARRGQNGTLDAEDQNKFDAICGFEPEYADV